MFDQRMLRPSSDHFYFQLVPNTLTIKDKALAKKIMDSNAEFRLKLQKGMPKVTKDCRIAMKWKKESPAQLLMEK